MFDFLSQVGSKIWRERIDLFWPIWTATTTLSVMLVVWVIPKQRTRPSDSIQSRRHDRSRSAIFSLALLALFLACYITVTLVWEDFAYWDNSMFTQGTLLGRDISPSIWPEAGRFFPLGHQEFNLLRHVTHSVIGYHSVRILQLVLLCGILLVLDEQLSIQARVSLIALVLLTPSVVISFSGLIYPEANVLFWLACLVWSVKRFDQTYSIPWAAVAVISAQFLLYYKETGFLLVLGFSVGRIILRCHKVDNPGWDLGRIRDPESRLDMCLFSLVALFLLYYLAAMYPNYQTRYADAFHVTLRQVFAGYVKLDLLVWALVAVGLTRMILILRGKVPPSPVWDGLALGGIGCLAGYLYLRLFSGYYLAPVDLIAVLYLGRLVILSIGKMRPATRFCTLGLLALIVVQDLSLSAFRMYERKNVIHGKAEIGRLIKARRESDPQNTKRLFFPFAVPYRLMEFGSYLSYLGVPVEGVSGSSDGSGSIVIVAKSIQKDGPCMSYRTVECHSGSSPGTGDLIVVLPDDYALTDVLNSYRKEGAQTLFSYLPRPAIPKWLWPYVNHLHVISPDLPRVSLPDNWMNSSVSLWR